MYFYETKDLELNLPEVTRRGGLSPPVLFCVIISIFTFSNTLAQFYEYGQDPGSVKWHHFSSAHYQIIYPRGLDSVSMQIADKLEYFYPHQARILDHEHGKIPVIIHNQSSFSNGVFVWAPKRLEIFTNPDPNGYPQDWLTQLAIHEGRHAFQVSKLNQGVSRGLSFVGGEQAIGAITGFLPTWYLEGDAVDAETRFSYTGRGRMPSFEMGMKALLLEKEKYSFSKATLGSYKDYVPNHYELGYLMVRYGRREYGDKFWTEMEDYASRKPYLIAPTWFSMKKYGVRSKSAYYTGVLEEYVSHWTQTMNDRKITPHSTVNRGVERGYTSYHFPQWASDSKIIALKSGIDQIPEFVLLDSIGEEERIFRPGFLNSGRFSVGMNYLIWDEWVPDIRWSNRNYSVIRKLHLPSGKVEYVGARTRYYTPVLSNSEEMIACIEQGVDQSFHLMILDMEGKVLRSVQSPGNSYIQHPTWMEQDSALVLTLSNQEGEFLFRYSLKSGNWDEIYYSGFNDISFPVISNSNIFFSGTHSGIDNIYCFEMETSELFMVTSSEFGAFEPSVSKEEEKLTYSDYHANGYNVATSALQKQLWVAHEDLGERIEQLNFEPSEAEQRVIDGEQNMKQGSYDPSPYNKILNAIHPHSWLPLYFDYLNPEAALSAEELPVSLGATLLSQNLLSTTTGMIGYEYKDKLHYFHTGVKLKGIFPVFDLRLNYGGYPDINIVDQDDAVIARPDRLTFVSSMYVPVRFNTGKYITFLQPNIGWSYSSDIFYNPDISGYQSGSHRFSYRLYFSSYLRKGRKDIFPRFGVVANAYFLHTPFDAHNLGSLTSYSASIYLPGFLKHQSLKIRYAHQVQNPIRYVFGNSIFMPRGTHGLSGLDIDAYSADYTFPLLYPDFSIEPIIYIKRIRANLWADYLQGNDMLTGDPDNPLENQVHFSYGIDLLTDLHPIRMQFPFAMGARFAYVPGTEKWKVEFLLNIDI